MGRWKLRLRPSHLPAIRDLSLPDLPPSTTVDKIFEHYLGYLKRQLQAYITAQYADGANIWNKLFPAIEVVLSTPNGWEFNQQQRMRLSAQAASLVSGPESTSRVRFVSEAEVRFLVPVLQAHGFTMRPFSGCSSLRYQQWMYRGMVGGMWFLVGICVTPTQHHCRFNSQALI
jgi:hypothetical protein